MVRSSVVKIAPAVVTMVRAERIRGGSILKINVCVNSNTIQCTHIASQKIIFIYYTPILIHSDIQLNLELHTISQ